MEIAYSVDMATKEHFRPSDIVFETVNFYAVRASYGFDVYQNNSTGAARVSRIGYRGQVGLDRVKAEIVRRETREDS